MCLSIFILTPSNRDGIILYMINATPTTHYRAADNSRSGEGTYYATTLEHASVYLGGCDGDGGSNLYQVTLHRDAVLLDVATGSEPRSIEKLSEALGIEVESAQSMQEAIEACWEELIMAGYTHVQFDDVAGDSIVKLDDTPDSLVLA